MKVKPSDKTKHTQPVSENAAELQPRDMLDFSCLGQRIREIRQSLGLSGEKLAEQLNISPEYLRQIESGKSGKVVSLPLFVSICNTLQISPDYLLQDLLADNELTGIQELGLLWDSLPPAKQKLAVAMIRAAIACEETRS
ncbi:MAG: helix-turn-helix domain-containing protein [Lachnospiraceae bacterium]|nr:helix-turn-helix domain-containing protein [Lachnospiraceae bacterium]